MLFHNLISVHTIFYYISGRLVDVQRIYYVILIAQFYVKDLSTACMFEPERTHFRPPDRGHMALHGRTCTRPKYRDNTLILLPCYVIL